MAAEIEKLLETAGLIAFARVTDPRYQHDPDLNTLLEHISAATQATRRANESGVLPTEWERATNIRRMSLEEETSPSRRIAKELLHPYFLAEDEAIRGAIAGREQELIQTTARALETHGLHIAEASAASGLPQSTIRDMGRKGWEQFANASGTQRNFNEFDLVGLMMVKELRATNMSLTDAIAHIQPIRNRAVNPSSQG